ncbi:unnamed protein product [Mytilus edulis]|uniref:Tyr recombinase domain-containing protein n=1 Tax=Mytilus edulis TaxID=6550 RepID=A0A8S3RE73_MYTED|nr:unnamed protein product [Mytilus edulis]
MGTIMKDMASKCDLQGRKVNHSSRKTFGQTLLNGGRPLTCLTEVADLGGWKSIESVKSYVTPSIKQQQMASDTISSMLIPSTESNASISEADESVLDKLSPTGATCTSTSSEIYSSTVDVASIDTQLQSVHTSDLPLAAVPLGNSSVNINEQSTVNNLNMPTFDMSKINGILYGANISCGTFNFHFNANKQ